MHVHAGRAASRPAWIGENALVQGKLGTQATTAQVHPARFTEAMLQAAIGMGARLRLCVTGVVLDAGRTTAEGVQVDGALLDADVVVIAMGPWSMVACRWLPLPAVHGLKGNSVVPERRRDLGRRPVRRADNCRRYGAHAGGARAQTARPTSAAFQPTGTTGRAGRCGSRRRGTGYAATSDLAVRVCLPTLRS